MGKIFDISRAHLGAVAIAFLSACVVSPESGVVEQDPPTPVPIEPISGPNDPRIFDPALGLTPDQIAQVQELFASDSCGGFTGDSAPILDSTTHELTRGILAHAYVPPSGFNSNDWKSIDKYIGSSARSDVVRLPNNLYFSDLAVKTRPFTAGFPLMGGGNLKNDSGADLFEWFALKFEGFIELADHDDEGSYEFAMLVDDGVSLSMGAEMQKYLEYTSVTPSRLVCPAIDASHGGLKSIAMDHTFTYPYELSYFQGARYHIAVMMLWRKARPGQPEPLCNANGNTYWFDSPYIRDANAFLSSGLAQPPDPTSVHYTDLVSRGWSPVPKDNFRMPNTQMYNPCMSQKVREILGWD